MAVLKSRFADPLRAYVAFLMNGDGVPMGTPNRTFIDSSYYSCAVTPYLDLTAANAATSQSSMSPFAPIDGTYDPSTDGGSIVCATGNDNIRIAAPAALGTSNFTIEMFIYLPTTLSGTSKPVFVLSNAANAAIDCAGQGFAANLTLNRQMQFYICVQKVVGTGVVPTGVWTHIAWVRNGASVYQFINGVLDSQNNTVNASINYAFNGSTLTNFIQGVYYMNKGPANSAGMSVMYSEVRLSNIARYTTAGFAVPTAPFVPDVNTHVLLHGANAEVFDPRAQCPYIFMGTAQVASFSKHGSGSIYMNGTTDYVKMSMVPTLLNTTSNDFTWEAWIYPTRSNVAQYCWSSSFQLLLNATTLVPTATNTYSSICSGPALTLNAWNHVAIVRSGSMMRVYTNGVGGTANNAVGSMTINTTNNVGTSWLATGFFQGYMDDIRFTKDQVRYTGNFTPPDYALTL
jgi:hypothetical protein